MVQMPPSNKDEFWSVMLVRVPADHLGAVIQELRRRAEPQQYGGGWYIKRIEILRPANPGLPNPYALSIDIKAATQAMVDNAVIEIGKILAGASGGTATWDVYAVTGIGYSANW